MSPGKLPTQMDRENRPLIVCKGQNKAKEITADMNEKKQVNKGPKFTAIDKESPHRQLSIQPKHVKDQNIYEANQVRAILGKSSAPQAPKAYLLQCAPKAIINFEIYFFLQIFP